MVQPGKHQRFFAKTLVAGFIGQSFRGNEFNRNVALEPLVVGKIHFAHPTSSNLVDDGVTPQRLPNHGL